MKWLGLLFSGFLINLLASKCELWGRSGVIKCPFQQSGFWNSKQDWFLRKECRIQDTPTVKTFYTVGEKQDQEHRHISPKTREFRAAAPRHVWSHRDVLERSHKKPRVSAEASMVWAQNTVPVKQTLGVLVLGQGFLKSWGNWREAPSRQAAWGFRLTWHPIISPCFGQPSFFTVPWSKVLAELLYQSPSPSSLPDTLRANT